MEPTPSQLQPTSSPMPGCNVDTTAVAEITQVFPKLENINRPTVDTAAAAYYMNRKQQTLRVWACYEDGPIRPLRVHGRLAWSVNDIKSVMGVQA
jgi:hypothetical protein